MENQHEDTQSLSFSEKMRLVEDLHEAVHASPTSPLSVEEANDKNHYKDQYDQFSENYRMLLKKIDEVIPNKGEFAEQIEDAGDTELADWFRQLYTRE